MDVEDVESVHVVWDVPGNVNRALWDLMRTGVVPNVPDGVTTIDFRHDPAFDDIRGEEHMTRTFPAFLERVRGSRVHTFYMQTYPGCKLSVIGYFLTRARNIKTFGLDNFTMSPAFLIGFANKLKNSGVKNLVLGKIHHSMGSASFYRERDVCYDMNLPLDTVTLNNVERMSGNEIYCLLTIFKMKYLVADVLSSNDILQTIFLHPTIETVTFIHCNIDLLSVREILTHNPDKKQKIAESRIHTLTILDSEIQNNTMQILFNNLQSLPSLENISIENPLSDFTTHRNGVMVHQNELTVTNETILSAINAMKHRIISIDVDASEDLPAYDELTTLSARNTQLARIPINEEIARIDRFVINGTNAFARNAVCASLLEAPGNTKWEHDDRILITYDAKHDRAITGYELPYIEYLIRQQIASSPRANISLKDSASKAPALLHHLDENNPTDLSISREIEEGVHNATVLHATDRVKILDGNDEVSGDAITLITAIDYRVALAQEKVDDATARALRENHRNRIYVIVINETGSEAMRDDWKYFIAQFCTKNNMDVNRTFVYFRLRPESKRQLRDNIYKSIYIARPWVVTLSSALLVCELSRYARGHMTITQTDIVNIARTCGYNFSKHGYEPLLINLDQIFPLHRVNSSEGIIYIINSDKFIRMMNSAARMWLSRQSVPYRRDLLKSEHSVPDNIVDDIWNTSVVVAFERRDESGGIDMEDADRLSKIVLDANMRARIRGAFDNIKNRHYHI